MNRQFKFRGRLKSANPAFAGRWSYGGLFYAGKRAFIVLDDCKILNCTDIGATEPDFYISDFVEVDPATVGRIAGLLNKREIYEGDIVKTNLGTKYEVAYRGNGWYPFVAMESAGYNLLEYEIIGNVHENSNLLEGENA